MVQQESKEPCKKEACYIQACLSKNNFLPEKCLKFIEQLQACCEKCNYNSKHCASVSSLLKQKHPQITPMMIKCSSPCIFIFQEDTAEAKRLVR